MGTRWTLGITPGFLGSRFSAATLGGFGGVELSYQHLEPRFFSSGRLVGGAPVTALGEDSKASGAVSPGLRSSWCLSPSFSPSSSSSYHLLPLVEKIPGSSRVGNPFPVGAGGARSSITWRSHYNPFPTKWTSSAASSSTARRSAAAQAFVPPTMTSRDANPGPASARTAGSVPSQDPSQAWA